MRHAGISRMAAPLDQQVTDALRDDIVTGTYPQGTRPEESTLCEAYQVSRTVVREALRLLESEGLVLIVPNRGPEIAKVSKQNVHDLYEGSSRT